MFQILICDNTSTDQKLDQQSKSSIKWSKRRFTDQDFYKRSEARSTEKKITILINRSTLDPPIRAISTVHNIKFNEEIKI